MERRESNLNQLLAQSAEMWESMAELYASEGFHKDAEECRELAASRRERLENAK